VYAPNEVQDGRGVAPDHYLIKVMAAKNGLGDLFTGIAVTGTGDLLSSSVGMLVSTCIYK
jgi:hypothetical protein